MKYLTTAVIFLVSFLFLVSSCAENVESQLDNKVPESEMVHVVFSLQWILENDTEPHPGSVHITFPVDWLENSPEISEGEAIVELDVPRLLMEHNDMNDNPKWVTVHFPNYYFSGLPEYKPENTISPP